MTCEVVYPELIVFNADIILESWLVKDLSLFLMKVLSLLLERFQFREDFLVVMVVAILMWAGMVETGRLVAGVVAIQVPVKERWVRAGVGPLICCCDVIRVVSRRRTASPGLEVWDGTLRDWHMVERGTARDHAVPGYGFKKCTI